MSNYPIRKVRSIEDRFWEKVGSRESGPNGECWEWDGAVRANGYGVLNLGRRGQGIVRVHRLSWSIHHGDIPAEKWVLHRCDNRRCVNPGHLFLGNRQDNIDDCVSKLRHRYGDRGAFKIASSDAVAIFLSQEPYSQISKKFGVSNGFISRIKNRQSWARATSQIQNPGRST